MKHFIIVLLVCLCALNLYAQDSVGVNKAVTVDSIEQSNVVNQIDVVNKAKIIKTNQEIESPKEVETVEIVEYNDKIVESNPVEIIEYDDKIIEPQTAQVQTSQVQTSQAQTLQSQNQVVEPQVYQQKTQVSRRKKLSIESGFWRNRYYYGDEVIRYKEYKEYLETDDGAFYFTKRAKAYSVVSTVSSFIVLGIYGTGLLFADNGGTFDGELTSMTSFLAVAFAFNIASGVQLKRALRVYNENVDEYNSNLGQTSFWQKTDLNLLVRANGVGFSLTF